MVSVPAADTHGASASAARGTAAGIAVDTVELGHTAGIHSAGIRSAAAVEGTERSTRQSSRTAGCIADPWRLCIVGQGALTKLRVMS